MGAGYTYAQHSLVPLYSAGTCAAISPLVLSIPLCKCVHLSTCAQYTHASPCGYLSQSGDGGLRELQLVLERLCGAVCLLGALLGAVQVLLVLVQLALHALHAAHHLLDAHRGPAQLGLHLQLVGLLLLQLAPRRRQLLLREGEGVQSQSVTVTVSHRDHRRQLLLGEGEVQSQSQSHRVSDRNHCRQLLLGERGRGTVTATAATAATAVSSSWGRARERGREGGIVTVATQTRSVTATTAEGYSWQIEREKGTVTDTDTDTPVTFSYRKNRRAWGLVSVR